MTLIRHLLLFIRENNPHEPKPKDEDIKYSVILIPAMINISVCRDRTSESAFIGFLSQQQFTRLFIHALVRSVVCFFVGLLTRIYLT